MSETTTQTPSSKKPKAGKKSGKATKPAKAKKATKEIQAKGARSGSKAEKVLEMMRRKEGATLAESRRPPTGRTTAFEDSSAGTLRRNSG